jgi:superfamily II DNA or RNA helicase
MAHLPKTGMSQSDLFLLKRRLVIIPKPDSFNPLPTPIRMYEETDSHILIPREYFFSNMTSKHEITITATDGHPMQALPPIKLRPKQIPIVSQYMRFLSSGKGLGGILSVATGSGKCFKKGTRVIKADGSIELIENLKVGAQLMGPDSTPRNVSGTNKGHGDMFEIIPVKGDPWGCNGDHILSLKLSGRSSGYSKGDIVNITLKDYLKMSKSFKHIAKLYHVPLDFETKEVEIDPYLYGIWLGDGLARDISISCPDKEIINFLYSYAKKNGYRIYQCNQKSCPLTSIRLANKGQVNPLRRFVRSTIINDEKRIKDNYLRNNRKIRLELLAGLIDTDGYNHNNCYEITTKYKGLSEDILFLARSLGFRALCSIKRATIKSINFEGYYYRISISGDLGIVPCKVKRKKAHKRQQKKDVLVTGFKINPVGKDDFYGVELDGDHLFCLEDMTVTHNSIMGIEIGRRLGRATLIKVYKDDLADQWETRIREFMPTAKIGRIQGDKCIYKGCDFVIAMIQTLISRKEKLLENEELVNYFGFDITDEVRRVGAQKWSETINIFPCKYRLGLDATVRRKDGCIDVFKWHIGDIVATGEVDVLEPDIFFKETGYSNRIPNFHNFSITTQLQLISKSEYRNKLIVIDIVNALMADRKILVISKFVEHLQELSKLTNYLMAMKSEDEKFEKLLTKRTSFYVGALYTGEKRLTLKGEKVKVKENRTKEQLDVARGADCIFATYKKAEDAFDQPDIDCLFMALPVSDPEQTIGRTLRLHEGKKKPIVVDIVDDNVNFFRALKRKRIELYTKKNWPMKVAK